MGGIRALNRQQASTRVCFAAISDNSAVAIEEDEINEPHAAMTALRGTDSAEAPHARFPTEK
jgi:hypothetical protein